MKSANSRFAAVELTDLEKLADKKDSKHTQRSVKRSVSLFREFLDENNKDFESLDKVTLNEKLRLFYASVRSKKGENLKATTLQSLKYGLSRHLKNKCKIDVITDAHFRTSQEVYKAVVSDLKKKGFGCTRHIKSITEEDLKKLYNNKTIFNVNTPYGLQKKVWFELMFYLCRDREVVREMNKSTFAIGTDSNGLQFVYPTKNEHETDLAHHYDGKPDSTVEERKMYARPGDPMCPVESFKKYLQKIHPDLQDLWQRPLESFDRSGNEWYFKSPLGKNSLSCFMTDLSKLSGLSCVYTNYSIRLTPIKAMENAGLVPKYIKPEPDYMMDHESRSTQPDHDYVEEHPSSSTQHDFVIDHQSRSVQPEFMSEHPSRLTQPDFIEDQQSRCAQPEFVREHPFRSTQPDYIEDHQSRSPISSYTCNKGKRSEGTQCDPDPLFSENQRLLKEIQDLKQELYLYKIQHLKKEPP
ncbi:uncharacterized protein LOC110444861 [Mizuhopecten yessoensis]|uniref:uncharacterized protein LOC110444861 n=2 Tax=Mizuhopecten yessoensis TaxID=6573 RepID=UPI000B459EDD|nr:uncharacterized protein LOC110444861 [Mizuhopecten yessoensis]